MSSAKDVCCTDVWIVEVVGEEKKSFALCRVVFSPAKDDVLRLFVMKLGVVLFTRLDVESGSVCFRVGLESDV